MSDYMDLATLTLLHCAHGWRSRVERKIADYAAHDDTEGLQVIIDALEGLMDQLWERDPADIAKRRV